MKRQYFNLKEDEGDDEERKEEEEPQKVRWRWKDDKKKVKKLNWLLKVNCLASHFHLISDCYLDT